MTCRALVTRALLTRMGIRVASRADPPAPEISGHVHQTGIAVRVPLFGLAANRGLACLMTILLEIFMAYMMAITWSDCGQLC